MRSSLTRAMAAVVGGSLLVGCASPTSPAPIKSLSPSSPSAASGTASPGTTPVVDPAATPVATTSSQASEWPNFAGQSTRSLQLGPDGTAYILTDAPPNGPPHLIALDAGGRVKPGWPVEATPEFVLVSLAVGPDGSAYVAECMDPGGGCLLHRLDATGRELPGWPFEVSADFACDVNRESCYVPVVVGSDGTAYLETLGHQKGRLDIIAVDASGVIKPGWPVEMEGHAGLWSNLQIAPDGTLFVVWRPVGRPIYSNEGVVTDDIVELWAFAPDGRPRPGWPVAVPEIGGYLFGPQGTIVVWSLVDMRGELCPGPRRTVFTVLNPDGRTAPGWPHGSTGFSSSPTIAADGTVYFVTTLGNVYAYDRAGELKAGWPAAVPGVLWGCDGAAGANLAPDGTIYVVGDELTARSPDGRSRPGWPYRPSGELSWPCIDTDCGPVGASPVFGPDGTVYIVVYQADSVRARFEVVALDPAGQVKPGWPVRLPIDPAGDYGPGLTVVSDGRLFVQSTSVLLSLNPDGTISD